VEAQLRDLGFEVLTADDAQSLTARLADVPAAERVAVVDRRFTGHLHALRLALTDPRFAAAAIPGALSVQAAARPALVRALAPHPESASPAARPGSRTSVGIVGALPDQLAERLDDAGLSVQRPELGVLVAAVPADDAERDAMANAVDTIDDEAVRLRNAVKSRDGFFTTHFVSPYSRHIARWCARRGLTPNQVTTASLLVALVAAGCAATGTRVGFVTAGVALIASFVLDCTDGQLARYSLQYSTLGAWLDATFDRVKEYAYYAGLALGAARGGDDVWALALGAMVLQTCRHVVDFAFNEANRDATGASAGTSPTAALSGKLDSVGWTVWARRMIVLPIGERWALIAVLTAATTPRITFCVLLIGCAFAACYTTAGRVLRSVTRPQPPPGAPPARRTDRAARALADLADTGPLAEGLARLLPGLSGAAPFVALLGAAAVTATAALAPAGSWWPCAAALVYVVTSGLAVAGPLTGGLDWLIPPLFRAGEYATVLAVAAVCGVSGALPAAFGLVAAVAYHHYDTVYRIRGGTGAPPRTVVRMTGGHEGRTLVVTAAAAALAHGTGLTVALAALAGLLAVVFLTESIRFWVSSSAPAAHDETGEPA
jgi:phosphatidylglycerophosphate synthase